jgi:molecular chaperone Hsp33
LFNASNSEFLTTADIIEEYFNTSLQRTAQVHITGESKNGYVSCVHAMMCEILPAASAATLQHIRTSFDDSEAISLLNAGADIHAIAAALQLGEATELQEHPVRFACSCSSERVMAMLSSLPKTDLEAMIAEEKSHDIYCHMCGKGFTITPEQLKALL